MKRSKMRVSPLTSTARPGVASLPGTGLGGVRTISNLRGPLRGRKGQVRRILDLAFSIAATNVRQENILERWLADAPVLHLDTGLAHLFERSWYIEALP